MTTPAACGKLEVGRFYMVPCVRLIVENPIQQHPAAGKDGWIPVIGPEHHDREVIGFQPVHIHIDVRFVCADVLRRYGAGFVLNGANAAQRLMGHPVSTFSDGIGIAGHPRQYDQRLERKARRLMCKREMPNFPGGSWGPALTRQHAGCKLKPGNICPHRGIDLTPFVKDDGTVTCPGHGLRWDTKTGESLPYHARAA